MSETTKFVVPFEPPQPAQDQPRPAWAAKSLHAVRMPRREVQLEPEWVDNGPNVEVRWREVEQQPTQPYQQHEVYMEDQSGGHALPGATQQPQQPQLPQQPNPLDYDLYDDASAAQYHQDNNAYIQNMVQQQVQSAMQPHRSQLREAELAREYNAVVAEHGDDPNFKVTMEQALQMCLDNPELSIPDAFAKANNPDNARLGRGGNGHLPEALRRTRKTSDLRLGAIMLHNAQTGRARPFAKKGGW